MIYETYQEKCFYCGESIRGRAIEWHGTMASHWHPDEWGSIFLHPKCTQEWITHLASDVLRESYGEDPVIVVDKRGHIKAGTH